MRILLLGRDQREFMHIHCSLGGKVLKVAENSGTVVANKILVSVAGLV